MANPKPTDYIPDMELLENADAVTEAGIFIPLASLPGLTAAEADPATGNGNEVVHKLLTEIYSNYVTLPTKPTKLDLIYGESQVTDVRRRIDFSLSFLVTVPSSAFEVESEPVA